MVKQVHQSQKKQIQKLLTELRAKNVESFLRVFIYNSDKTTSDANYLYTK